MHNYVAVALVALAVVIAGLGAYLSLDMARTNPPPDIVVPEQEAQTVPVATSTTYASSTMKFSIDYPISFRIQEQYTYDAFGPQKRINGVKFLIPEAFATGTNLSAIDTGLSVEVLPRARACVGDIYLQANVASAPLVESGMSFSRATSTSAAAGNIYEEHVFALASSSPCIAVRYFIHSTNIANYATGTVREYDAATLLEAFDTIRRSIRLTP